MSKRATASEAKPKPNPRTPLTVRRAILPWRRRIRNIEDYDWTPGGWQQGTGDPISGVLLLLMFPLWILAIIAFLIAIVEFALALPFLPFALLQRRIRHSWPVEILDRRGGVLERSRHPSWAAAGEHAASVRDERNLDRWV